MADALVVLPKAEWADPWGHPEYYVGITAKRMIAYLLDALVIMVVVLIAWAILAVAGVFTLGLAWAMLGVPSLFTPLLYHTLLIGGSRSATLGMRLIGIRVMSLDSPPGAEPGRPSMTQAAIQTVAFYGSLAVTGSLTMLVALFNARRRTLHDWLAGTVVVNDLRGRLSPPSGGGGG